MFHFSPELQIFSQQLNRKVIAKSRDRYWYLGGVIAAPYLLI